MKRLALLVGAHVALLAAPVALLGRAEALGRPRSIACLLLLVALSMLEARATGYGAPHAGAPLDRDAMRLGAVSGLALLVIAWLALGSTSGGDATCWLGAPLAVAGVALRVAAIHELGPGFTSAIEPGRHLVTAGIYGRVRHPSELGLLLVGVGIAVLGGSLLAGAVLVLVLIPSSVMRLEREERSLYARFGAAHQAYRARVGGLFPRGVPAANPRKLGRL